VQTCHIEKTSIPTTSWSYIVWTYNQVANIGSSYLNSNFQNSTTAVPGFGWGTLTNLYFGNRTDLGGDYAGSLADILIWDKRVLSNQEIRQLYAEPYCFIEPRKIWVPTAGGALGPGSGKRRYQLVG
jgi:hypothetical protein